MEYKKGCAIIIIEYKNQWKHRETKIICTKQITCLWSTWIINMKFEREKKTRIFTFLFYFIETFKWSVPHENIRMNIIDVAHNQSSPGSESPHTSVLETVDFHLLPPRVLLFRYSWWVPFKELIKSFIDDKIISNKNFSRKRKKQEKSFSWIREF